uniref:DDE_3 domain-containing protein n=1 Tax=Caenorhabditis japonica TaxID=281687 RepID=A0A8R1IMH2_CAEJA
MQIALFIGRSINVVNNYIKDPLHYGTEKLSGRPSLLSDRDKWNIVRKASNAVTSCAKIKSNLDLNVSSEAVTFSDEKNFNCDGPDGYRSYWHDLRKQPLRFSRRNLKGGVCMVWVVISSVGRVKLCFVSKRMDGAEYRICLRRNLTRFWHRNRHHNFIFMQDGAPCHRARRTIIRLEDRRIPFLDWPACSRNMNFIENVWGYIVHKIYEGNKSYDNVAQLKKAIVATWLTVDQ